MKQGVGGSGCVSCHYCEWYYYYCKWYCSYSYQKDVALISLANILHRARYSNEAAILVHSALDLSRELNVNHFTLGNIYAVSIYCTTIFFYFFYFYKYHLLCDQGQICWMIAWRCVKVCLCWLANHQCHSYFGDYFISMKLSLQKRLTAIPLWRLLFRISRLVLKEGLSWNNKPKQNRYVQCFT